MKKICVLFLLITSLLLISCSKEISSYDESNIQEFDELLKQENIIKYDLRDPSFCEEGHIPSFMCIRQKDEEGNLNALSDIFEDIKVLYDKNKTIVLISSTGLDAKELAQMLGSAGYNNIHYLALGYEDYVEMHDDFIPETGCNC